MTEAGAITIAEACDGADIAAARGLFREYARSLGFSLAYQDFAAELAGLPGKFARPAGRLLLARSGGEAAGVVALRPLETGVCEMKRLYVPPAFRGLRLGEALVERVIAEARAIGYGAMRLDTVAAKMPAAVALYRRFGFTDIPAYYASPIEGTAFMELRLRP